MALEPTRLGTLPTFALPNPWFAGRYDAKLQITPGIDRPATRGNHDERCLIPFCAAVGALLASSPALAQTRAHTPFCLRNPTRPAKPSAQRRPRLRPIPKIIPKATQRLTAIRAPLPAMAHRHPIHPNICVPAKTGSSNASIAIAVKIGATAMAESSAACWARSGADLSAIASITRAAARPGR